MGTLYSPGVKLMLMKMGTAMCHIVRKGLTVMN